MQLKDVKTVNEVRNVINIDFHDHQIGMPRGQAGPMLCLNAEEHQDSNMPTSNQDTGSTKDDSKEKDKEDNSDYDLNAAYKGKGKDKRGSKGYGECWHCGEWGHPRRECPHLNDPTKAKGALSALRAGKTGGGKGKGKYGKGGKGKGNGKGKWGKRYNQQYRYPGKGVGKGLNELSDDWYNAWGNESGNDYDNGYYWEGDQWDNYGGNIGNVTMLLERGESATTESAITTATIETGELDPFRNTRRAKLISVQNRFEAFQEDSEIQDEQEDDAHNNG